MSLRVATSGRWGSAWLAGRERASSALKGGLIRYFYFMRGSWRGREGSLPARNRGAILSPLPGSPALARFVLGAGVSTMRGHSPIRSALVCDFEATLAGSVSKCLPAVGTFALGRILPGARKFSACGFARVR